MGRTGAEVMPELERLAAAVAQWDPADKDKLLQVRWTLDDVRGKLPASAGPLVRLVELTQAGATVLCEEFRPSVAQAVVDGLGQLSRSLADGGEATPELAAATEALRKLLEPDPWKLLPDDADRELLGEYVTENLELIQGAEAALLTLETEPDDGEAINTVFRAFHTIKGTSAFIGITPVAELAHKAETLLSRVRDKQIRYGGHYADLALRSADTIKELMYLITAAMAGETAPKPTGYDALLENVANPDAGRKAHEPEPEEDPINLPHFRMADILVAERKVDPVVVDAVASARGDEKLGTAMVKAGVVSAGDVADALRKQKKLDKMRTATVDASVRVRTDRLDRLIEMVGELVIAHSMVAQDPTVHDGAHFELARKTSHMGKIVRELQDLSMAMRMVPLKSTFQKMARLVRDVAQKVGKEVDFQTQGEETEIDRNMVDAIGDPLVHMIRNSVDHGLETPDERSAAGKDRQGRVELSAFHAGGSVVVTISDNGRGLDREKIVRKAIQKGVIDTDKGLSDQDVYNLLFAPGFSTAEKVTDVSGRGVGLDVVRRNVESMRGRIDIQTRLGEGTMFTIYLPLTLAITDGMLIRVGSQRYIMPTSNIGKTFRPSKSEMSTVVGRGEMVSFQGQQVPVFRLSRLFRIEDAIEDATEGLLLVIRDGIGFYALLADEIIGQQQIVAKSLGEGIAKIPGVSGGAILGDGRVGLILDPPELGALARRGESGIETAVGPAVVA